MSATVEHHFDGGFRLNEQRLRKLADIVADVCDNLAGKPAVRFKVSRRDSYSYETSNIDDVASEDNDDWRAISRLDVLVTAEKVLTFRLSFGPDGSSIELTGSDRGLVLLLYGDIRAYMEDQVLTWKGVSERGLRRTMMMLALSPMLLVLFLFDRPMASVPTEDIDAAIASVEVADKLNALLARARVANLRASSMPGDGLLFVPLMILVIILVDAPKWAWSKCYPTNVFLFGGQEAKFDRSQGRIQKVLWTLGLGIPGALIAGIILRCGPW